MHAVSVALHDARTKILNAVARDMRQLGYTLSDRAIPLTSSAKKITMLGFSEADLVLFAEMQRIATASVKARHLQAMYADSTLMLLR